MGSRLISSIRALPFSASDWMVLGFFAAVIAAALVWLLAAASLAFSIEVPARGGEYHEGIVGTPRFINPVLAVSDADRDLTSLIFSGLLRQRPDGTLVPDIAESYVISDDKRTYTFTMRDALFHDGTSVSAEDVAFTVLLAQNPLIKSPKRANWEGVTVTVIDSRTVSFTLKEPYAPFLANATLGILPKHLWQSVNPEEFPFSKLNIEPVGQGPFSVERLYSSEAGIPEEMLLSAWLRGHATPYLSRMRFTFFNDSDELIAAAKKDQSLAVHSVPPDLALGRKVNEAVLGRVFGVFFNQNSNDLFADRTVREALNASLDKQKIVDTLIGGYGSPIEGPLPPKSIGEALKKEDVDQRQLRAASMLTDAGWAKGEDGVFVKKLKSGSKRLSFTLTTSNAPELKALAEAVRGSWVELGAEVSVQFFDQNDLQQDVIRPRKYDALLFGEVIGRDLDLFAFWHSSQRNDPGLNIALYANISVDKALTDARGIDDIATRREKAEEAASIIEDEVAAVFLYSPHFLYLTPQKVSGIELGTIATPADRFANSTEWYLATERVWPVFAE